MDLRNRIHRRRPRDTAKLAAQLAPPEERKFDGAHQEVGAIVVDNGNGGISNDLIEGGNNKWFGLEPVVLVIVLLMLAWILFITWRITEMPLSE
jgi:hypothetical protein